MWSWTSATRESSGFERRNLLKSEHRQQKPWRGMPAMDEHKIWFKYEQQVQLLYTSRDTRHNRLALQRKTSQLYSLSHRHFQHRTARVMFQTHPNKNSVLKLQQRQRKLECEKEKLWIILKSALTWTWHIQQCIQRHMHTHTHGSQIPTSEHTGDSTTPRCDTRHSRSTHAGCHVPRLISTFIHNNHAYN